MPYSDDPPPPSPAQSWAPPKNPLPPHRLARLANALGVSTPMPAIHTPTPMVSASYNGSSPALDQYRRSPTPSSASTFGFAPATSKYLLHVIPPIHLPHDSFDSELTPPPSTASGYHTQFRRGTLVPVHATFQSQLGAIAKEYALPSTAGLILYLVSNSKKTPPLSEKSFGEEDDLDEPGPRLSEDIWRHLWTRVVKTEIREEPVSLAPPLLGLSALANRSTPYLNLNNQQAHAFPLPLLTTNTGMQPLLTPSPTTPSSTSEPPARFHTKSAPPSSSSRSGAETPDTSQAASSRADSLDLPGLNSDAIIPILAKVEFDIDRRKAAWYEPWLRSRRLNHAKRKNSFTPSPIGEDDERPPPLPLPFRLGKKDRMSLRDKRYLPLSESPQSMGSESEEVEDEQEEEEEEEQDTRALDDAEDADESSEREDDDDGVQDITLSIDGRGLGADVGPGIPGMLSSPSRKRAPPPTPLVLAPLPQSGSSPANPMPMQLPNVAPPSDEDTSSSATPPDGVDRTRLAYLDGEPDAERDLLSVPPKSVYNPSKRRGDIYEDMDLGFEVESSDDFDVDDPNDRRKSQLIMRAQLDEIEKNLAQFSPRMLRTDLESPTSSPPGSSFSASGQYPPMPSSAFMPMSNADVFPPTPRLPIHPDAPENDEEGSDSDDLSQQAAWPAVPYTTLGDRPAPSPSGQHFPPQLAVNGVSASMPKGFRPNTTTSSSRASSLHSNASSESELRKRDLAANYPPGGPLSPPTSYPAMTPSIGPKSSLNSPLIPLSPDPFGRHASQAPEIPTQDGGKRSSKSYWESPVVIPAPAPPPDRPEVQRKTSNASLTSSDPRPSLTATTSSSRFSTDSMHGAGGEASNAQKQANRTTLMSVKGIKNLWRKSQKKESISLPHGRPPMEALHENAWSPVSPPLPRERPGNPAVPLMTPPLPGASGAPLAPPPVRPNRPSMEDLELPDVEVEIPPRTPLSAGFPGRPPRPAPPPGFQERRPSTASLSSQERKPSMSQERRPSVSQERRPSQDVSRRASPEGMPMPPPPSSPHPNQSGFPSRRASPEGMPMPPPSSSPHPSQSGFSSRRASPDGMPMPPSSPHPHQLSFPSRRASPEQVPPLPHIARRPSDAQLGMPSHQPHMSMQGQLSVPPPMLQSTRHAPIVAAKAGPPRPSMNDGLLWDQESPYPTRITPPGRAPSVSSSASRSASRPPSPTSVHRSSPTPPPQTISPPLPHNSPPIPHNSPPMPHNSPPGSQTSSSPPMPPQPSPPTPEREHRNSVRKSILKWKSQTHNNGGGAVPAPLTPSSTSFRARKASLSGSPSQGSPLNLPMDIPPSPKIPDHFMLSHAGNPPPPPAPTARPNSGAITRRRLSAKMASTSTDSSSSRRGSQHHRPRESTASSAHSEGTHESSSLDTSGFEIVSPKTSSVLSFPYTELDHDRPFVDGVRM
ncbi:hypothetical protein C8R45DRAFT_1066705 [Mycena sanguinolenta]|nr:hypothetical protein C8R45DRAFT_1066705 [Mycena sanguinolenta]